jgi:hypothetical protein
MKRLSLVATVLLLIPVAWAMGSTGASAGGTVRARQPSAVALSATLFKTFSSKVGPGTTVKVSTDGNVIGFASPTNVDHIDAGLVVEGYVLCYTNPITTQNVDAFDLAYAASGFGPSTDSASPVSVTRTTSDGVLQLAQTFTFNGRSRSLQITMTVSNISGKTVTGVGLRREVDFDIDAGGTDGTGTFNNLFGTTIGSVFAYNDSGGNSFYLAPGEHGMMLRSLYDKLGSKNGGPLPGAATSNVADTGCTPTVDPTPAGPVDDGASFNVSPVYSLTAGGTFTEAIEYDAF